jgi:hypothetical protein
MAEKPAVMFVIDDNPSMRGALGNLITSVDEVLGDAIRWALGARR